MKKLYKSKALISVIIILIMTLLYFAMPYVGVHQISLRIMSACLAGMCLFFLFIYARFRMLSQIATDTTSKPLGETGDSLDIWLEPAKTEVLKFFNYMGKSQKGNHYHKVKGRKFYLSLGAQGSGKSTLLNHSGVTFSKYPEQDDVASAGESFCKWYDSGDMVFMEIPQASYQENDHGGSDELSTFLKVLKQKGKDKCLDGIVVTVSLKELVASPDSLELMCGSINQQIHKALKVVELDLPVTVCFTHLDILPGFHEYFSSLQGRSRDQALGARFKIFSNQASAKQNFYTDFEKLSESIRTKSLGQIKFSNTKEISKAIFQFPVEFYSMRNVLGTFIEGLFKNEWHKEKIKLRGFYFTSIVDAEAIHHDTSQGATLHQFVEASKTIVTHPLNPGRYKEQPIFMKVGTKKTANTFFTKVLFQGILKNEQNLVEYASYRKKARSWYNVWATAATITLAILMTGLGVAGYQNNRHLTKNVSQVLNRAVDLKGETTHGFAQEMKTLDRIGSLMDSLKVKRGSHWKLTIPGFNKIPLTLNHLRHVYYYNLHQMVNHLALADLRASLFYSSFYSEVERNTLYNDLMVYIALTHQGREHRKEINRKALVIELARVWVSVLKEKFPQGYQIRNFEARVEAHAERYVQDLLSKALPLDGQVDYKSDPKSIGQAREVLRGTPSTSGLYQSLERSSTEFIGLHLGNIGMGRDGLLTSESHVRGFYTKVAVKNGALDKVNQAVQVPFESDWVMGKDKPELPPEMQDPRRLERELKSLYFKTYIEEWSSWLKSLTLQLPDSFNKLPSKLRSFASYSRGFPALLLRVKEETHLVPVKNNEVEGALNRKVKNSLVAKLAKKKFDNRHDPRKKVEEAFVDVQRLVGSSSQAGLMKHYFEGVVALSSDLEKITLEDYPEGASLEFLQQVFRGKHSNPLVHSWSESEKILEEVSDETRLWLQPLMQDMLIATAKYLKIYAERALEQAYQKEIYKPYTLLFKGRFPFDKKSGRDVNPMDLDRFFNRDNGAFYNFYQKNVEPFVKRSGAGLQSKNWNGIKFDFSEEVKVTFAMGSNFSKKAYQTLANEAKRFPVDFNLQRSGNAQKVSLLLEDKNLDVNDQIQFMEQQISWPGDKRHEGALLTVSLPDNQVYNISGKGPWGALRLLEKARVYRTYPGGFEAKFRVRVAEKFEIEVKLKGRVSENESPFTQKDFYQFEAAPKLLEQRPDPEDVQAKLGSSATLKSDESPAGENHN